MPSARHTAEHRIAVGVIAQRRDVVDLHAATAREPGKVHGGVEGIAAVGEVELVALRWRSSIMHSPMLAIRIIPAGPLRRPG